MMSNTYDYEDIIKQSIIPIIKKKNQNSKISNETDSMIKLVPPLKKFDALLSIPANNEQSRGSEIDIDDNNVDLVSCVQSCQILPSIISSFKVIENEESNNTSEYQNKSINYEKLRDSLKIKKNSGQAYVTKKGRQFNKKELQPTCKETCKFKCTSNFSYSIRQKLLQSFWKMADVTRQRTFVVKFTIVVLFEYKNRNILYFLPINDIKKRVCKKFFMATLNIGDTFIKTAILKGSGNNDFVEGDLRGKHGKNKKINTEIMSQIINHINSFPRLESHYLRIQTSAEFIDRLLTLSEMWKLFDAKCKEKKIPSCKFSTYIYIFKTKFNIKFITPKNPQCGLCQIYYNSNEIERFEQENNLSMHRNVIQLLSVERNDDKDNAVKNKDTTIVACYGLQNALITPSGKVSSFYYSRKFSTNNLTVYNMGKDEAICYLWNEDQARRSANEINTCIYKFLIDFCINKQTIFYSDNCCGQQNKKFMISLYLYAVTRLNIPSITHKYLIVGHTLNEGDFVNSIIERHITRILKSDSIYSPQQWSMILQSVKKTGKPLQVKELVFSDFINFKKLNLSIGKNFNENTNGQKVIWNDIKIIKVSKDLPDRIQYKYSYDQNDFLEVIVNTAKESEQIFTKLELAYLYKEPLGISKEKKSDLVNLCDNKSIPGTYHYFYKQLNIISDSTITDNTEDIN